MQQKSYLKQQPSQSKESAKTSQIFPQECQQAQRAKPKLKDANKILLPHLSFSFFCFSQIFYLPQEWEIRQICSLCFGLLFCGEAWTSCRLRLLSSPKV